MLRHQFDEFVPSVRVGDILEIYFKTGISIVGAVYEIDVKNYKYPNRSGMIHKSIKVIVLASGQSNAALFPVGTNTYICSSDFAAVVDSAYPHIKIL